MATPHSCLGIYIYISALIRYWPLTSLRRNACDGHELQGIYHFFHALSEWFLRYVSVTKIVLQHLTTHLISHMQLFSCDIISHYPFEQSHEIHGDRVIRNSSDMICDALGSTISTAQRLSTLVPEVATQLMPQGKPWTKNQPAYRSI